MPNRRKVRTTWPLICAVLAMSITGGTGAAQTWTRVTGVPSETISALADLDGTLYAAGEARLYCSRDKGVHWDALAVIAPDLAGIAVVTRHRGVLYAGTYKHGLWRSSDEGATWQDAGAGLTGLGAADVLSLAAIDDTLYAGTGGAGVFRLTPSDEEWVGWSTGLSWNSSYTIQTLTMVDGGLVATAGANGEVFRLEAGSREWKEVLLADGLIPGLELVSAFRNGNRIFLSGSNLIHFSDDEGRSWKRAFTSFPSASDARLAEMRGMLFAALNTVRQGAVLCTSTDQGMTWEPGSRIGATYVAGLLSADSRLYAACENGLWVSSDIPTTTPGSPSTPAFHFLPNHPNPFHTRTALSFTLAAAAPVSIDAVDVNGRVFTVMPAQQLAAGGHHWVWDTATLPPGVYVCRLQAGDQTAIRSVLHLP